MIIAHRSNTINDTYRNVYQRNVNAVEIDIQLTKDNKMAVFHDDMTSKRMKQLYNHVGPSLVSLEEFLRHTPDGLDVYIELKNYSNKDYVYRVVHLTKKYPKKKYTYLSFDPKFCHQIRSMKRRAINLIDAPEKIDEKMTDVCVHASLLDHPTIKKLPNVSVYDVQYESVSHLEKKYPFVKEWIVDFN